MEFEDVAAVGRRIADSLDRSDLTGRWMAHHLAEVLAAAGQATGPAQQAARQEAADLILAMWDRRDRWPARRRPLESLEPIHAALDRLRPDQPDWDLFRFFKDSPAPHPGDHLLLDVAVAVERSARDVIRGCIVVAAAESLQAESDWLAVAEQLNEEDETAVMRRLSAAARRLRPDAAGSEAAAPEPAPAARLQADIVALRSLLEALERAVSAPAPGREQEPTRSAEQATADADPAADRTRKKRPPPQEPPSGPRRRRRGPGAP